MWIMTLEHLDDNESLICRLAIVNWVFNEYAVCFPIDALVNLNEHDLHDILDWLAKNGNKMGEDRDKREHDQMTQDMNRPTPPKPPKPGWIYLMKAENGYYKIGRSKNVPARQKQLNREFPIKIEVIHLFWANDYISREKDLLFLFQDKQQEGEWFALDQGDVETIRELQDEEPEPTS